MGDRVEINVPDNGYALIEKILPRKNSLIRPPISNIDNLIIVTSICEPIFNTLIIDKMIAAAVNKNIKPILVVTKSDLKNVEDLTNGHTRPIGDDENSWSGGVGDWILFEFEKCEKIRGDIYNYFLMLTQLGQDVNKID